MKHTKNLPYTDILKYIDDYWDRVLVPPRSWFKGLHNPYMQIGRIRLPGSFISPNHTYFGGTQFYWDSYFTILGLVDTPYLPVAKSMVNNLCYLQHKFGLIPARNSLTSMGRTQPPYLTRMAYEVYDHQAADKDWMQNTMQSAEQEYYSVWTNGLRFDPTTRLSSYHPKFLSNNLTIYESGWDKSLRFSVEANKVLPVDLNCLLYQYEADFLAWAKERNDVPSQNFWQRALVERRQRIDAHFWNTEQGFYYDYSLVSKKQLKLKTLAGFYPLWCGVATPEQAEKCRATLGVFETAGGLTSTEKMPYTNLQWDYPNGWAPLQWVVIEGLRRYGYHEDADRLSRKWLDCNRLVFDATGHLWEKYDVVERAVGRSGRYPTQSGFAWTNSIFLQLHNSLTSP